MKLNKTILVIAIIIILAIAGYLSFNYLNSKKKNQAAIDLYIKNMYDWLANTPEQRSATQKKAEQQGNTLEAQLRADAQWYTDHTSMDKILENYEKRQHKTA